MASHTYSENLQIVRSTGVYGQDVREAIAELIEQAGSVANDHVNAAVTTMNSSVTSAISQIESTVAWINGRVNSRNVYMTTTVISDDEYLLTIQNHS